MSSVLEIKLLKCSVLQALFSERDSDREYSLIQILSCVFLLSHHIKPVSSHVDLSPQSCVCLL